MTPHLHAICCTLVGFLLGVAVRHFGPVVVRFVTMP